MIKRISVIIAVILFIAGCGGFRYINPQPEFTWPEMQSSKISGKLGIYVPEKNVHYVYKADKDEKCCNHKSISVGKGLVRASEEASRSVFNNTIILEGEPTDTYIKSLDLRGLLHIKDTYFVVEFVPFVDDEHGSDDVNLYTIKVGLELKSTAIDFLMDDIRGFTIDVNTSSSEPVSRHGVDGTLKKMVNVLFELAADHLAKELVIIYGART
jgi:hypothetical protein